MRTYLTNCLCPKCNGRLRTTDVKGYAFVCPKCDENFYSIEVTTVHGENAEIIITGVSEAEFTKHVKELQNLSEKMGCHSLGYAVFPELIIIGLKHIPTSKEVENLVKVLDKVKNRVEDNQTYL